MLFYFKKNVKKLSRNFEYSKQGGGGGGGSLIKVGADVRLVQSLGRAQFLQNPNARAKKCSKTQ